MNFLEMFEYFLGLDYTQVEPEIQQIMVSASAICALSFCILLMWGLFLFVKGMAHGK